jgi:NAD dependent epimerase/dehydratase family enzyme
VPKVLLAFGAAIIGTATELVLKSRKVYPQRLLDDGFVFEFPDLKSALVDLCQREKRS